MSGIAFRLRWQDVVDIAIIAFITYQVINLIRGTRTAQMLIGFLIVLATYLASQYFELHTLNWVLSNFLASVILLIVVVFQNDIRRALTQVGAGRSFAGAERIAQGQVLEEVVRSAVLLASKRIGALLVFERDVNLNEYIEVGTRIEARVSRELLQAIFLPTSPVHDGAVIIQQGRITAAGCFLPLTVNPNVSKTLGTRHRAAIGLTEETDGVVVVVSEEEGKISLVREGRIIRDLDAGTLRSTLQQLFAI
ncbi:MAG: TIGR00159 family protein [Deltaproteobacteria bacterium]|nr:TIGR00159 family protein [Deltaproteobacteria bacterium]